MDYKRVRRRKRQRRRKILQLLCIVILLALIAAVSCFLVIKIINTPKKPEYTYYSLSEEATARAYVWLSRIDDMPLSYDEVRDMMGDINLKVVKTPVPDGSDRLFSLAKPEYTQSIAEGAYDNCKNQARTGLEKAYKEVLKYRLVEAGYEGDIPDEMLNDIMKEAYGMSVSAYLSYCKIQLLPDEEALIEMYSGDF